MKLFKNKNSGPKVKREDVVIPEEYLEYERRAEERRSGNTEEHNDDALFSDLDKILSINTEEDQTSDEWDGTASYSVSSQADDEKMVDVDADEKSEEVEKRGFSFRRKKKETVAVVEEAPAVEEKEKRKDSASAGSVILLSVLLTVVVAAVVVLFGPLMNIDRVEITKMQNMTDAQVTEMANNPVGQNLFRYSTSKAVKAIELQPYVQSVEVKRHFPHWIEIVIDEREPAGILLNNSAYLQFSKDGVLLDSAKSLQNQSLPLITGFSMSDVPSPGEKFGDNARFSDALAIINACTDELLASIQEINIQDRQNILAYTSQGIEIRLGSVENINERMAVLNDIINQVVLSDSVEEPIAAIDIRYEKAPVIVLEGYENYTAVTDEENENKKSTSKDDNTTESVENNDETTESSSTNDSDEPTETE